MDNNWENFITIPYSLYKNAELGEHTLKWSPLCKHLVSFMPTREWGEIFWGATLASKSLMICAVIFFRNYEFNLYFFPVNQRREYKFNMWSHPLAFRALGSRLKSRAWGFPGGSVVKNPPASAGDTSSIPSPGKAHMPRSS